MALSEHDLYFEGIKVHCWEGGTGFPIVMLHGSGPGASTLGNWRHVMDPLAERYHVLAADLVGFGLSGRKPAEPYFDLDLWVRQGQFLIDRFPDQPVGLVAHSLSAYFAFRLALANVRVTKLLLTGAVGRPFRMGAVGEAVWTFPETREQLRATMEAIIADHSMITEDFLDNRMAVLSDAPYREYFSKMFAGDKQKFLDATVIPEEELAQLKCEVTLVHGKEDQATPFEETAVALCRAIRQANLYAIARCGHGPALEQPDRFMSAAKFLFG